MNSATRFFLFAVLALGIGIYGGFRMAAQQRAMPSYEEQMAPLEEYEEMVQEDAIVEESAGGAYYPVEFTMENGQMMTVNADGNNTPMVEDITLESGTTVYMSGEIVTGEGETIVLQEGEKYAEEEAPVE